MDKENENKEIKQKANAESECTVVSGIIYCVAIINLIIGILIGIILLDDSTMDDLSIISPIIMLSSILFSTLLMGIGKLINVGQKVFLQLKKIETKEQQ